MSNIIDFGLGYDLSPMRADGREAVALNNSILKSIAGGFTSAARSFPGLGSLIGIGALAGGLRTVGAFASEVKDLSETTNLSTDAFQRLSFAVTQSGGTQETFVKTMIGLQQAMEQAKAGTGTAAASFEKLGISLSDIALGDPQKVLLMIADAMQKSGGSGADFAAVADLIGVKVATKMVPSLKLGSAGFMELANSASIASAAAINSAENAQDAWDRTGRAVGVFFLNLFDQLAGLNSGTDAFYAALDKTHPAKTPPAQQGPTLGEMMDQGHATGETFGPPSPAVQTNEQTALDQSRQKNMEEVFALSRQIAGVNLETAREGMTAAQEIASLTAERSALGAQALRYEQDIFKLHQRESAELRLQQALITRRIAALARAEKARLEQGSSPTPRAADPGVATGEPFGPTWAELHRDLGPRTSEGNDWATGFKTFEPGSALRTGGLRSGGLQSGGLLSASAAQDRGPVHRGDALRAKDAAKAAKEAKQEKMAEDLRRLREITQDAWGKH